MSPPLPAPIAELLEAWNAHDPGRASACCAPEYESADVGEPELRMGPQGMRHSVERYVRAFPDLRIAPDEILVEGERIALAWTAHGTHRGLFMRIPPTSRPVVIRGVSLLSVGAGRVQRAVCIWDVAGLLRQLGLLPDLPPS